MGEVHTSVIPSFSHSSLVFPWCLAFASGLPHCLSSRWRLQLLVGDSTQDEKKRTQQRPYRFSITGKSDTTTDTTTAKTDTTTPGVVIPAISLPHQSLDFLVRLCEGSRGLVSDGLHNGLFRPVWSFSAGLRADVRADHFCLRLGGHLGSGGLPNCLRGSVFMAL